MTVKLYTNHSANNVANKNISEIKTITADFPLSFDVINPSIIVNGKYPECNYIYIPYVNRYYYCKATILSNNTTKLDCKVDVLMTAKDSIYGTTQYVARCETSENNEIIDSTIPLKNEYTVYCTKILSAITPSTDNIIIGVIA